MTLREYFVERFNVERPYFANMLKALPKDRLDYKPHERSQSAHDIAWLIAGETECCLDVVKEFRTEWKMDPAPALEEIVQQFEKTSAQLVEQVKGMKESDWEKKAGFYYQGKMVLEKPAGEFLWYILFDLIHHRGQLTAYVRPMGGKVPAIYGPSADEKGGMI